MGGLTQRSKHPGGSALPAQLTPFIGRTQEIAEIGERLADPSCRLLTLTGPGGIGKTRLAIQAAAEAAEDYPDGVHFVDLQPLRSIELLPSAIADAIGAGLHGSEDPRAQLLAGLRDKRMLLLLDNFEQLVDGVDLLADILRAAPGVVLLVTSREALNLQGEWRYRLQGLPYPTDPEPENVEEYGAVQLFVERARRVRPTFSLAAEREGVARICRLVEGMPLAIELAAAWTKTLRCDLIAAEIERNLEFLTSSMRDLPERHRSVQAVFDHSWRLLGPAERGVFTRLSVFRGGFGREAAERVAGASLPILAALVDKSLLRWQPDGRYQIHELLRQWAAEQLEASPEEAARVRDAHAAYYARFLEARDAQMNGGPQRQATAEIEAELENVRAAWQWAVEQGRSDDIRRAADALYLFYQFQSRYREGAAAFEQAVRSLGGGAPTGERGATLAEILVHLGWLSIRLGQLEQARETLERSRALYAALDLAPPPRGMATDPLVPLGVLAVLQGEYAEAARLGEIAHRRSSTAGDRGNLMFSFYLLASACLPQGRYQQAHHYARRAYTLAQEMGNRWFLAYCVNQLGSVARALGRHDEARRHYQAAHALREEFDDPEGTALALNHLAEIAALQRRYPEARHLYHRSLAIYREIGDRGGLVRSLDGLGATATALGDHSEARRYFREALQVARGTQFVPLALSLLIGVGDLLLRTGRPARGLELLAFSLHHPAGDHETRERAQRLLDRTRDETPARLFAAATQRPADRDLDTLMADLQVDLAVSEAPSGGASSPDPSPQPPDRPLADPLTPRELEVLRLLAEGRTNPEIAEALVISVGTVKAHTHRIYSKLDARNRLQAVARAAELNLL